jgi:acetyl-CoA synthetase
MSETAAIHPVAPRIVNGLNKPHVGPNIHAYQKAHAETVGPQSDQWWAKVRESMSLSQRNL